MMQNQTMLTAFDSAIAHRLRAAGMSEETISKRFGYSPSEKVAERPENPRQTILSINAAIEASRRRTTVRLTASTE